MRIGPYEVLAELGRGGMGVVYRARHATLGREVALKVMAAGTGGSGTVPATLGAVPTTDASSAMLARFRREAQAAGRLAGHPHIVAVHDVGEAFVASDATNALTDARRAAPSAPDEGAAHDARPVLYLAMDLVIGRSLDAIIAEGELSVADAVRIAEQIAQALAHAHAQGILHRDVKPGNVMVESARVAADPAAGALRPPAREFDGAPVAGAGTRHAAPVAGGEPRARLTDFGLATSRTLDAEATRLTMAGELLGTPAYMPPEQVRGEGVDARADVYALGATLYEMLAGTPPFAADSIHGVLARVLSEPAPRLAGRIRGISSDLDTVVRTALAKRPDERYASAAEFAADLGRVRRGERVRRAGPDAGRRRRRTIVATAAVVAVAAAGVAGVAAWRDTTGRVADATAALGATAGAAAHAERARGLADAWYTLDARTLDDMRRLQDWWNGAPGTSEELRATVARVETVAAEVAAAHPGLALPAAWTALARFYGSFRGAGAELERLAAQAGDDPFPPALLARAALAQYVEAFRMPRVSVASTGETSIGAVQEDAVMRGARERAQRALTAALASPLWPDLTPAAPLQAYARGAMALASGRHADALAILAPLTDEPLLGGEATYLVALARYLSGDMRGAVADFERVAERGWARAIQRAGVGLSQLALFEDQRGGDGRPLLERAFVWLDRRLAWDPTSPDALGDRATACWAMSHAVSRHGDDPLPWLERAVADHAAATVLDPEGATGWSNLGTVRLALGDAQRARGVDARPTYREGIAAFERAMRLEPDAAEWAANRAHAREGLAEALAAMGEDPVPMLVDAVADLDGILARAPDHAWLRVQASVARRRLAAARQEAGGDPRADLDAAIVVLGPVCTGATPDPTALDTRGNAWEALARVQAEARQDPREALEHARDDFDAALRLRPGGPGPHNNRGNVHRALAEAAVARGDDPLPHYLAAEADYAAANRAFPGEPVFRYNQLVVRDALADLRGARGADVRAERAAILEAFGALTTAAPGFWQAGTAYAGSLERLGRTAEAIAAYERVLAAAPGAPGAAARLARLRGGGKGQ